MAAIILFRFHRAYDVCVQTLTLLRKMNPETPIHGLYGGNDPLGSIPVGLTKLMDSIWEMPLDDAYYKWKNGDLVVRRWFKDYGHTLTFDHVYLTEWDMLFLKPLHQVFPILEKDVNYASIFGDYETAKKTGWYWIKQQFGEEVSSLLKSFKEKGITLDFRKLSFAILGGAIFCRKFLTLYAAEPVASYSNDEVRLSLYSAAYNIPLKSNGIMEGVDSGKNLFNAEDEELFEEDIDSIIRNGGWVIHPIRQVIENLDEKLEK